MHPWPQESHTGPEGETAHWLYLHWKAGVEPFVLRTKLPPLALKVPARCPGHSPSLYYVLMVPTAPSIGREPQGRKDMGQFYPEDA